MIERPDAQSWAALRRQRPAAEEQFATMPVIIDGCETDVLIALDSRATLHLFIPVQGEPPADRPGDLNGLRVRQRTLGIGVVLDLTAPPSHEAVFTPFCREVIEAVVLAQRDPWKAVAATIRTWKSAWRPVRLDLDKAGQVGLMGELLVLRTLLIPVLGPHAVSCWSGPDAERHDFVCGHALLEVKTTRKSRPEHEIARLDQLRCPAGRQLFLASVQLEQTIGGDCSLASEIDAIVAHLRAHPWALDAFMASLVDLGWSDEFRHSEELLLFRVRNAEVYAVDGSFPRLPDDFEPPSGVVSLRYTIDLANIPTVDVGDVQALIAQAHAA